MDRGIASSRIWWSLDKKPNALFLGHSLLTSRQAIFPKFKQSIASPFRRSFTIGFLHTISDGIYLWVGLKLLVKWRSSDHQLMFDLKLVVWWTTSLHMKHLCNHRKNARATPRPLSSIAPLRSGYLILRSVSNDDGLRMIYWTKVRSIFCFGIKWTKVRRRRHQLQDSPANSSICTIFSIASTSTISTHKPRPKYVQKPHVSFSTPEILCGTFIDVDALISIHHIYHWYVCHRVDSPTEKHLSVYRLGADTKRLRYVPFSLDYSHYFSDLFSPRCHKTQYVRVPFVQILNGLIIFYRTNALRSTVNSVPTINRVSTTATDIVGKCKHSILVEFRIFDSFQPSLHTSDHISTCVAHVAIPPHWDLPSSHRPWRFIMSTLHCGGPGRQELEIGFFPINWRGRPLIPSVSRWSLVVLYVASHVPSIII